MPQIMRTVIFVVFDRCQILDFSGPVQAFTLANPLLAESNLTFGGYRIKLVSADGSLITTESGVVVQTKPLPRVIPANTTLLLAGGPGVEELLSNEKLRKWFQRVSRQCERFGSVCTGSLALSAWKLLDGKRATTHWISLERLAQNERITVDGRPLYVRDGNTWTSAGISAGIDMALAMIETDAGVIVATTIARQLVLYSKRSGGQSQFGDLLGLDEKDTLGQFINLHQWIRENVRQNISLSRMAEICAMSERTFSRRYSQIIGMSPFETITRIRVEMARTLLTTTQLPISVIARKSGFATPEMLAKSTKKLLGVAPRNIREAR